MTCYHPERYWSRVAEEIKKRGAQNYLAGDDTLYYRHKHQKLLSRFLNTMNFMSKVVLEVGCGPGGNLREILAGQPHRLIGVDISQTMLETASQNLLDCHDDIELRKIDGMNLPFPDKTVDVTLTVTVLQHNADNAMFGRLVQEMCRVTKQMLVLVEETGSRLVRWHETSIERPVQTYQEEVCKHGFELVGVDYLNTRCTRLCDRVLLRIWRILGGNGHQEGEPFPMFFRVLEGSAILVAKAFDDVFPERAGLTKMVFCRKDGAWVA